MSLRSATLGFGVVLGAIGLVLVFVPSVSVAVRVPSVVVASIALLALVVAFHLVRVRFRNERRSLAFPAPENHTHPIAGEATDRRIRALSMNAHRGDDGSSTAYAALRTRMKRLVRLGRSSFDEQARLSDGTNDHRAAAVLTEEPLARLSVREHVHCLWTGESPVQHRARRAITALVRRLDTAVPTARDEEVTVQSLPEPRQPMAHEEKLRFPEADETITRRTDRWRGISALALAVGAGGMLLRQPALLLAGGIGVCLAAYSRAASPPSVSLAIKRTVEETEAGVRVTVTVRNVGDVLLPDCSVIDGVPSGLVVTAGSPRQGTALRPDAETTFSYTLTVVPGKHSFTPPSVIARDSSASVERLTRVEPSGDSTITCAPQLEPLETSPLRTQTTRFDGRRASSTPGHGIEFYGLRAYRSGDPRSRIDWNRLAKTGELSTLQFRTRRRTAVVIVIDARKAAYLAPDANGRCAVDRSVTAAGRLFSTLLDANVSVGITALSAHPQACWLAPNRGPVHRRRGRQLLTSHPALAAVNDQQERPTVEQLCHRLPTAAQVVVLTPLCDDAISASIQQLEALGHPVTVISPDPTTVTSPGRQLVHAERALRSTRLRSAGIPVLDWQYDDESLSTAIDRLERRRSAGATAGGSS
ncbi:DUF58 domain-containing protein [Halocatena salina]|uniref:DUF58 domain-containing protein n=1 Tax=Halocatena salina TaxID=2934340 RepID=A0A8U0A5W4_9EURY|nr:DUF58 domain-containing protein [Halocatena salina]UPM44424.1 DUF58 domain-containing protein [Halocatena salina]